VITLIDEVELFTPDPMGMGYVVLLGDHIAAVGSGALPEFRFADLPVHHIAGRGLIAVPGFIDPHQHLIGGSGETGFQSQTPEVFVQELVRAGITTVVGCLGVDTWTRTMPALLGKVKGLRASGISAFAWTGGYPVPPANLTGSSATDILYIEEILGAGEIAISDMRGSQPEAREVARLASEVRNAGLLSGKAGVTHFHVGSGRERLKLLHIVLDEFEVDPGCLYPTHVQRSEALMREAVELTRRGSFIDMDTYEEDLVRWLSFYLENRGDPGRLTISTDTAINSPQTLIEQLRACVRKGHALESVLPFATTNTARVLKLQSKGRIEAGMDADILLLNRADLGITHVIASGRLLLENQQFKAREAFLHKTNRKISLHGKEKS
jgi:beta-aspartyl-dipeptidase (metallo-type)